MAHWEPTPSVDQRGERDGGAFRLEPLVGALSARLTDLPMRWIVRAVIQHVRLTGCAQLTPA